LFVTTKPTPTALTNGPHPTPDRPQPEAAPSRSEALLTLVHTLIAFGKTLLDSLQTDPSPDIRLGIARRFVTNDVALIIRRITRGLLMAAALHDRLVRIAKGLDNPSAPLAAARTPSKQSRPPRAPAIHPDDDAALLARLPTAREIAALIRHRPIGRVLEDICLDLGIRPSDKLWRQLNLPIILNGGNFARILKRTISRAFPANSDRPVEIPAIHAPPLQIATGPS
jgi:hypothetical protein